METGIAFLIGLIAGACLGDFMAGRKIKMATSEAATGGGYQPIKPWPTPAATSPRPPAPKGGSGVAKIDTMTVAERVDGYMRLAEITASPTQKQVFIEKVERILNSGIYTNELRQGCRAETIPPEMVK